ncbi:hypothetical protein [Duganella violaceipulchra]|uniref:Uncharacterized protein n=1 Tax=Duganella violaceipulchra TaxID=2849652 RepID=A0AA41L7I2_9BURK|nr:hypothetical protein [Duganella violaceicalia]MBV6324357.1 hypothetical protein [Duganella violaceicalia]MCP2007250.1 hypothetical protein [Duganella violaceicalia]
MTFEIVVQVFGLVTSSGVLAGGLGLMKWALAVERRLMTIEVKTGVKP